ncbi:FAD-binding oxidoreductase [Sphingosinicella sp. LHD-64]|uniref:NAD(P)/FAD-dependent oxidoreductase n=1 Tax=Sphingosinicella sp. LHD-64 TaxID=3072139 RepID=UPI00280D7D70|nr:FAD-binding oxidoreductase [Sphingosinicella sp. LHD-64]MDQ8757261.1 FAD-binding oxidoreductase [Sphingosinicella sp. LHD-64]
MDSADFLIIGGGVAGLSAGARLARHGRVVVLEAEEALGFHSSGRSATFSHYGIGNHVVRVLTEHSRRFFLETDGGALARSSTALYVATAEMRSTLDALAETMAAFTDTGHMAREAEMLDLFPPLRTGGDAIVAGLVYPDGLRLDSDAMLQHFARTIRTAGGAVLTRQRIARIGEGWTAETEAGERWTAPVLINAAGAWADRIAELAGVAPLGLTPKRRTIIVVDPPAGANVRGWPFVKTVMDDFYILPESGRLMASPVDEIASDPCDAQPEEYDIALTAAKVEEYTTLSVARIAHRWAGLRTFTADRTPAAGFDTEAPGFLWLAGQGGFGLQTAPAMAEAVEALVTGSPWPGALAADGVTAAELDPARLR